MKAMRMHGLGGPEVLRLDEVPAPTPGPGEILVAVRAASVNPADWKLREGFYKDAAWFRLPHIPGRDFSGTVAALGPGVTEFREGDEVFGVTDQGQEGAYAERLAVSAAIVARKPPDISHAQAAAMALGALTALVSLEDTAKVARGETVLVHGGAGGVGAMAVQIARHAGARVFATARASNADYLRGLGAEAAIAYDRDDFTKLVPACDVVFDTVGGEVQARSCEVLKPGGRLVWISRGPKGFEPPASVVPLRPDVRRDRAHLERIAALAAAGALRPPEITEFPLSEAGRAQESRRTGALRGKAVLIIS